jgi:hypothetical protein
MHVASAYEEDSSLVVIEMLSIEVLFDVTCQFRFDKIG